MDLIINYKNIFESIKRNLTYIRY